MSNYNLIVIFSAKKILEVLDLSGRYSEHYYCITICGCETMNKAFACLSYRNIFSPQKKKKCKSNCGCTRLLFFFFFIHILHVWVNKRLCCIERLSVRKSTTHRVVKVHFSVVELGFEHESPGIGLLRQALDDHV